MNTWLFSSLWYFKLHIYIMHALLYAYLTQTNFKCRFLSLAQSTKPELLMVRSLDLHFHLAALMVLKSESYWRGVSLSNPQNLKDLHEILQSKEPGSEKQARKRLRGLWKRRGRETTERRDPRYSFQMPYVWSYRGPEVLEESRNSLYPILWAS